MPIRILLPKITRITSPSKINGRIWKEEASIYRRLPATWKESYIEFLKRIPKPVHYIADERKYIVDHETGEKKRVQDVPIVVLYPKQSQQGIWGGEGVIFGYQKKFQTGFSRPEFLRTKLWRPRILKLLFYSEILDKYYALTCTRRTLTLIEEAKGFDFYILKTHQVDLNSQFAMQLKREMLIKLAKKDTDLYPNDIEKRERIYKRYKEFEVPLEKAEWIGLMPFEAVQKLKKIEQEKFNESIKPWKLKFTEELFEKLEKLKLEGKPLIEETKEKPKGLAKKIWDEWTRKSN